MRARAREPRLLHGLRSSGSPSAASTAACEGSARPVQAAPELAPVAKFARDDTTPIPRPSTYYGREHYHDIREENGQLLRQAAREAAQQSSTPEPQQGMH